MSEVGLALCAASAKSDQALIADILAWLRVCGVEWAADLIPNLTNIAITPELQPPLPPTDITEPVQLDPEEIIP